MNTRYDVGCKFEDPKSAFQIGFGGRNSATIFGWGRG